MTRDEMVRAIRVAVEDTEQAYRIRSSRIIGWLDDAYLSIQHASDQWKFLHQRGALFSTLADGTVDYTTASIKSIDPLSIYYTESGGTSRFPLDFVPYHTWVEEQTAAPSVTGPPRWLMHIPSTEWKVEPIPDAVYDIYADVWLKPSKFANGADSPLWDEELHDIVLFEAKKVAAAFLPNTPQSLVMQQEIAARLPILWSQLRKRYGAGISGPEALS